MYNAETTAMVPNLLERHSIGNRTQGIQFNENGSPTLMIQRGEPEHTSNWLPAPDGPFSLQARLYWPKPETLVPLNAPPSVQKV